MREHRLILIFETDAFILVFNIGKVINATIF